MTINKIGPREWSPDRIEYSVNDRPYTLDTRTDVFLFPDTNGDRIVCPCDKSANGLTDPAAIPAFHLHYGEWEIVATCIYCGKSQTVYDG
jgi:hypothetical protein